jgi:hypothetical protein
LRLAPPKSRASEKIGISFIFCTPFKDNYIYNLA